MVRPELTRLRSRGFTLLEMLTVVALIGIVASLGTTAFYRVTEAWTEQKALAELDASLDAAFNVFQADIADALSAEISGESIVGTRREIKSSDYFDRVLAHDEIVIPVQHAPVGERTRTGGKVAWRIDRQEGGGAPLTRYVGDLHDESVNTDGSDVIRNAKVVRLRFEFAADENPEKWLPEWNSDEMPAAVKMSITVEDTSRYRVQTGRVAVFPVRVR